MARVNILGINAYHGDSSACLVQDGELIAAVEEERFCRIKHWAGFPARSIRYCLSAGGIGLNEVDFICVNSDSRANLFKKIMYALKNRPDITFIFDRLKNRRQRNDIHGELSEAFPGERFQGQVVAVEHHLAHLVSAHCVSPFPESVCVSLDGFGDFSSTVWGVGRGCEISIKGRVFFPHSLGIFYQALTQFLGFPHYGDEYKVMGLAPYGTPQYLEQMRDVVVLQKDGTFRLNLRYFRHQKQGVEYEWSGGAPIVGQLFAGELANLLEIPARKTDAPLQQYHFDLARSVQAMYEEAFFHLLNAIHAKDPCGNLTLAGGCAMNSVANGKVYRNTPFKHLYLQPAAGDAGGAIGAAFRQWYALSSGNAEKMSHRFIMHRADWGPEYTSSEVQKILDGKEEELRQADCRIEQIAVEDVLCQKTAAAIAEGKVVGWFQGRMEWGPRALGNRSIVCDPRRADMKDILNRKIKRRESFRPFAPSVLRQAVPEWFEEDDDVPFMMQVFQVRSEKRQMIPAITHVDGSGRLQTVTESANRRYYRLISCFYEITGVPIVLNTSFNENEPIVRTPEQALDCFLRTDMDILVLCDFVLLK